MKLFSASRNTASNLFHFGKLKFEPRLMRLPCAGHQVDNRHFSGDTRGSTATQHLHNRWASDSGIIELLTKQSVQVQAFRYSPSNGLIAAHQRWRSHYTAATAKTNKRNMRN